MSVDLVADALSHITNCEKVGKPCVIKRVNKLLLRILDFMKQHGYIKNYERTEIGGKPAVKVELHGRITKAGAVKPRFPCKVKDIEKYEKRYLPARDFGILLISTPKGLMTTKEARERRIGGTLVAYVY